MFTPNTKIFPVFLLYGHEEPQLIHATRRWPPGDALEESTTGNVPDRVVTRSELKSHQCTIRAITFVQIRTLYSHFCHW